jgi:hypothetical protein
VKRSTTANRSVKLAGKGLKAARAQLRYVQRSASCYLIGSGAACSWAGPDP